MNDRIISSSQLLILLFIISLSGILFSPYLFAPDSRLWDQLVPFMVLFIITMMLLIPVNEIIREQNNGNNPLPEWIYVFFCALYGIFFLFCSIQSLYDFASFAQIFSGGQIDKIILTIAILSGVLFSAYKGIESIVRFSGIVFVIFLLALAMFTFFTFPSFSQTDLDVFNAGSFPDLMLNTAKAFSISPVIAAAMMLGRFTTGNIKKSSFIWAGCSFIVFFSVFILICGTSGNYLRGMKYPLFHAIDTSGILQRFDPLFIGAAICALFCSLGAFFYIFRITSQRVLKNESASKKIMLIAGIISGSVVLWLSDNTKNADIIFSDAVVIPVYILFSAVFPLAAFIYIKTGVIIGRIRLKRIMMSSVLVFCIILFSLQLCGCTSVQLNQKLIIQGIGVDKSCDKTSVTCIVLDTETEDSDNKVKIIHSEGNDFSDALNMLEKEHGKKIMLSHCLFVIIDKALTGAPDEILGTFSENREVIRSLNIMVSSDPAGYLIDTSVGEYGYTSEEINMLVDSEIIEQSIAHYTLFDHMSDRSDENADIPIITLDTELRSLKISGSIDINK